MPAPRKYPHELRERAQRMVAESMSEDLALTLNGAVNRIGSRVGVVPDTLRGWVKQAAIDAGQRPGITTTEASRVNELEREVKELKRANEILLAASSFFARELAATAVVIVVVDGHRARFGVAPICRVLSQHGVPIAPSTYYAARSRGRSARSIADEAMLAEVTQVHSDPAIGRGVYGARKVWHQLRRDGVVVARLSVVKSFGPTVVRRHGPAGRHLRLRR